MSQPAIQYKLFGSGKQRNTLPAPSEEGEQMTLIAWRDRIANRIPELRLLHHIPNGGWRGKASGGKMLALGALAGMPDLFLPAARGGVVAFLADGTARKCSGWHGLYIEMKRRGEKPTAEQMRIHALLRAQGYAVSVCEGYEETRDVILGYLMLKMVVVR